jgi:hypothetical protein
MKFEDEYKPRVTADFLIILAVLRITKSATVEDIMYAFIEKGKFE